MASALGLYGTAFILVVRFASFFAAFYSKSELGSTCEPLLSVEMLLEFSAIVWLIIESSTSSSSILLLPDCMSSKLRSCGDKLTVLGVVVWRIRLYLLF